MIKERVNFLAEVLNQQWFPVMKRRFDVRFGIALFERRNDQIVDFVPLGDSFVQSTLFWRDSSSQGRPCSCH
jgi:hypothetical protein